MASTDDTHNADDAREVPSAIATDPATGALSDSIRGYIAAGVAAYRRHDYVRAERVYRAWTQAAPNDPNAWNNLGVALKAQNKFHAALGCYWRALDLDPSNTRARINAASALIQCGRASVAVEYSQSVLTSDATNADWARLRVGQNRPARGCARSDRARARPHA